MNVSLINYPSGGEKNAVPVVKKWLEEHLLVEIDRMVSAHQGKEYILDKIDIDLSVSSISQLHEKKTDIARRIIEKVIESAQSGGIKNTGEDYEQSLLGMLREYVLTGITKDGVNLSKVEYTQDSLTLFDDIYWDRDMVYRLLDFYSFADLTRHLVDRAPYIALLLPNKVYDPSTRQLRPSRFEEWCAHLDFEEQVQYALKLKNQQKEYSHEEDLKTSDAQNTEKGKTKKTSEIMADNAGLLLIHPYILMALTQLSLVSENEVSDLEMACRILYYLATGSDEPKNPMLHVEKAILGIDPDSTIALNNKLSNEVKISLDKILDEMSAEWTAIKNSGIDFVRMMFLNRKGRIIYREKTITIIISKQAQDILLEDLKWGLGIIKFPWNHRLISIKLQ